MSDSWVRPDFEAMVRERRLGGDDTGPFDAAAFRSVSGYRADAWNPGVEIRLRRPPLWGCLLGLVLAGLVVVLICVPVTSRLVATHGRDTRLAVPAVVLAAVLLRFVRPAFAALRFSLPRETVIDWRAGRVTAKGEGRREEVNLRCVTGLEVEAVVPSGGGGRVNYYCRVWAITSAPGRVLLAQSWELAWHEEAPHRATFALARDIGKALDVPLTNGGFRLKPLG